MMIISSRDGWRTRNKQISSQKTRSLSWFIIIGLRHLFDLETKMSRNNLWNDSLWKRILHSIDAVKETFEIDKFNYQYVCNSKVFCLAWTSEKICINIRSTLMENAIAVSWPKLDILIENNCPTVDACLGHPTKSNKQN